ncbi:hypothetical protein BDZ91DRAFT_782846 [Kalaharituber pfeilii]|nr:hypothetical protein BDZ91DRAFT_782846 [Kalaharituber pfeilii]
MVARELFGGFLLVILALKCMGSLVNHVPRKIAIGVGGQTGPKGRDDGRPVISNVMEVATIELEAHAPLLIVLLNNLSTHRNPPMIEGQDVANVAILPSIMRIYFPASGWDALFDEYPVSRKLYIQRVSPEVLLQQALSFLRGSWMVGLLNNFNPVEGTIVQTIVALSEPCCNNIYASRGIPGCVDEVGV